jgi:hypothetical protein
MEGSFISAFVIADERKNRNTNRKLRTLDFFMILADLDITLQILLFPNIPNPQPN